MNAITPPTPMIPDNAPFTPQQRAWLNGFLAGLYGSSAAQPPLPAGEALPDDEEFPWHDPALEMDERLSLAAGKPLRRTLMAAMAQLDCGQCGYLCQTYAEALADGVETATSLCVPGARPTQRRIKELLAATPAATPATSTAPAALPASKAAPVMARVLSATRLTADGSAKDVRHVVIDLETSGLRYEAGDSLGIAAPNDPVLLDATLAAMGASGDEPVACPDGRERPLREAFATQYDIARPQDRTTDLLAMSASDPDHAAALRRLTDDGAEPADADLLDLLQAFPSARPAPADLARSLPALKPRLYSIASSPRATPGQVHLCVGVVRAERRGRTRLGIASAFLAHHAHTHGPIPVSVTTSHFRLPADPAIAVIMCGPGTGIAPFRAFLQERAALGLKGRTWLFFGDQHQSTDFLFETELRAWLADGTLGRLDTAFSRDQARKIYVQDRMAEHGERLWRWLQGGAAFYVCGDASRMARDVDLALRRVAMTQGGLDEPQAREWIATLARQGRYQRDVY